MASVQKNISIPIDVDARLREESELTGIPQSVIIRLALAARWAARDAGE